MCKATLKKKNIKMAITENEAYIQCPYTFGKDEEDALWIKGDIKRKHCSV